PWRGSGHNSGVESKEPALKSLKLSRSMPVTPSMDEPLLSVLPVHKAAALPAQSDLLEALPADTDEAPHLLSPPLIAEPAVDVLTVAPNQPQVALTAVPANPILRVWFGFTSVCEWLFGAVAIIVGLAILAALPVLQFLSLGYLLEAGGRVARA